MSDLIDVPDETVEQIARRMVDDATLLVHTKPLVRSVLAAALPVLRAQIEAETRAKVADEIEAMLLPFTTDKFQMDMRHSVRMDAARLVRGETDG